MKKCDHSLEEICDCLCHKSGARHIRACCRKCEKCGTLIVIDYDKLAAKRKEEERLEQEAKELSKLTGSVHRIV